MDGPFEKMLGHQICLSGPLLDKYLERIGKCMYTKLGKKHLTGCIKPIKEFIPSEIFDLLLRMFAAYGCSIHNVYPKKKSAKKAKRSRRTREEPTKIYVWIVTPSSCEKIFAPWRFDGTNYLAKRIFARKLIPGTRKRELAYDGQATVAVTEETPICLVYDCKTNIVKLTFFIQRYTAEGFAVDSTVQAQVNKQ